MGLSIHFPLSHFLMELILYLHLLVWFISQGNNFSSSSIIFLIVMVHAQSCSFQKNNHRMAPMMAASPIVQYQPLPPANLVRPLLDLHYNSPLILLPSPNHHSYHCYHQPKPHDTHCSTPRASQSLHMFHVSCLSHHTQHTF